MNPRLRLREVLAEAKSISSKAQTENRDFTADESAKVRSLLDEATGLKAKIEADDEAIKKNQALATDLNEFLSGAAGGTNRVGGRGAKSRDASWAEAMVKAVPQLEGVNHDSKSLTMPSSATFQVPAPGASIVAPNVAYSHLLDVVTVDDTLKAGAVSYLRGTERERASRVTAPGELKPSKTATLERVDAPALTIAVLLPGIDRQDLLDYEDLITWLDFELKADLARTLDQQMLLGTGLKDANATPPRTSDQFEGLFYTDGVQVQSFDTTASRSLRLAMAGVEGAGYENTALCLSPRDFALLELEVNNVGGEYRGNRAPAPEAGPRTVWGVPVASVAEMPQGLAIVGDFSTVALWVRETAEVRVVETNADDFARNQFLARAELRAAFGATVPQALSLVELTATATLPGVTA